MAVDPKTSVHVGNLPPYPLCEIEELLFELFLQIGPVVKVYVPYHKQDGSHKGYAFVEFQHEESVPYCCKMMHGIKLLGLYIGVNPAVSKAEKEFANSIKMEAEVEGKKEPSPDAVISPTPEDLPNPPSQNLFSQSNLTVPPPCPPGGLFCPPFPPPPFPSFPMHPPPLPLSGPPPPPPVPLPPPHLSLLPPHSFTFSAPQNMSMAPPKMIMTPPNVSFTPPNMNMAPPIVVPVSPPTMNEGPPLDVNVAMGHCMMTPPSLPPVEPPTFSTLNTPYVQQEGGGANGNLATTLPKSVSSILNKFDGNPFKIAAKLLAESKNCNQRYMEETGYEAEYEQPLSNGAYMMEEAGVTIDDQDCIIIPRDNGTDELDRHLNNYSPSSGKKIKLEDNEYYFTSDRNSIEVFDYNHRSAAACSTSPTPS